MSEEQSPPSPSAPPDPEAATMSELSDCLKEQAQALRDILKSATEIAATLAPTVAPPPLLTKQEYFASLVLMGLASRLQPIQSHNPADKQKVVDLAFEMADLAVKKSGSP